uniref:Uncharacterized protein MANES_04G048800 n=1 Tax=Rhizophora mucronata TaxID=61149 RepID=A0A2P2KBV0_RHIMU
MMSRKRIRVMITSGFRIILYGRSTRFLGPVCVKMIGGLIVAGPKPSCQNGGQNRWQLNGTWWWISRGIRGRPTG